jgi:thymidylate synthase (FAD)
MLTPVLDHGFIALEEHMGGDAAVVEAARICYQSESTSTDADVRLIRSLLDKGHNTPFEHAVMRWRVKCPIFVARQWMRHRVGTFNEKSLRYCAADLEYHLPNSLSSSMREIYGSQLRSEWRTYMTMLQFGVKHEDARGILGTAFYTEFVWTVNAWSFMNWLTKRLDKAAQWEHRQYAEATFNIWLKVMPITAAVFAEHGAE